MEEERTRVYLARHGEVVNHGVYNGQTDVDITATGLKQMDRLRDLLKEKKLAAVYSSDLLRTRKGAEVVARPHGLTPHSLPEFRELHFGRWQGLSYREVMEKYPGDIPRWIEDLENFRIPGGESFGEVRTRAVPRLKEFIDKHRGEEFAVICHGALNRVFLAEALHLPYTHLLRIEQDYGCMNILEYTGTWTGVRLMNG